MEAEAILVANGRASAVVLTLALMLAAPVHAQRLELGARARVTTASETVTGRIVAWDSTGLVLQGRERVRIAADSVERLEVKKPVDASEALLAAGLSALTWGLSAQQRVGGYGITGSREGDAALGSTVGVVGYAAIDAAFPRWRRVAWHAPGRGEGGSIEDTRR